MSRFFDSKQAFTQRLKELGMAELDNKFQEKEWDSFSVLAFATDYVPGSSPPELFIAEIVQPLVGDDAVAINKWKPLLKRLFVEAYTMAAHDIQSRTDGHADPDDPKRMPNAEREHRLRLLGDKLSGLTLSGELQPSYHLIDLCANMFDSGVVSYIGWEKCAKRDCEIRGVKTEKVWKPDSEGRIRETTSSTPVSADLGSDLQLKYALQRRGLALEVAAVCDYQVHSLWVEILFDSLLGTPPPGYAKVSLNQLKRADEEVWRRIALECRDGLKWTVQEHPPFERALKKVIFDPAVRLLLMPLPSLSASSVVKNESHEPTDKLSRGQKRRIRELEDENARLRQAARAGGRPGPSTGGGKGKSKAQGKGGSKGNFKLMADKMKNLPNGEPICFNFNIRGCPDAAAGARCNRGWHLCAEPGCQQKHAMINHTS